MIYFLGVLRDTTVPLTPLSYLLSSSQNRPFHYVTNILSNMEPVSAEYLDEEQDHYEQYYVNQFVSCKFHFLHHIIHNENIFCLPYDTFSFEFFFLRTKTLPTNKIEFF